MAVIVRVRTRREAQRRFFVLVAKLAVVQILIDAAEPFLGRYPMLTLRLSGATLLALGSILFEMYKVRRAQS